MNSRIMDISTEELHGMSLEEWQYMQDLVKEIVKLDKNRNTKQGE